MTRKQKEQARLWVEAWQRAGEALEKERRKRIRATNTVRDMQAFRGLATWALKQRPPLPTSGLVEQQRLFARRRR